MAISQVKHGDTLSLYLDPGGGDFGLHLVPGPGQHRELSLDGFLWHAAASAELLADVFPLPQWRCLTAR